MKVAFMLNGVMFLLGGLLLFKGGEFLLGGILLLATLPNISRLMVERETRSTDQINYSILAMNVIVCLSMALDEILSGQSFIQFAWLAVAVISILALVLQLRSRKFI